jgi:hypothetical protein
MLFYGCKETYVPLLEQQRERERERERQSNRDARAGNGTALQEFIFLT